MILFFKGKSTADSSRSATTRSSSAGTLTRQDLLDYLTRSCWGRDPRGNDDRSIVLLSRPIPEEESE